MLQENGTRQGGATPETESTAKILPERYALAIMYEALINEILKEAKDDSYWTTPPKKKDLKMVKMGCHQLIY